MHGITERVIFREPFEAGRFETAEEGTTKMGFLNHWTSPLLDETIQTFLSPSRSSPHFARIQANVSKLLHSFRSKAEALLHGDLHTGSLMINLRDSSLKAIDPEFSMMGPMGFDIGMILSNLWMHFFSRLSPSLCPSLDSLAIQKQGGEGEEERRSAKWILEEIESVWETFSDRFAGLLRHHNACKRLAIDDRVLEIVLKDFLQDVWRESVGFGAIETVRRIIGVAHVSDFSDDRSLLQKPALSFAFDLLSRVPSDLPSGPQELISLLIPFL